MRVAYFGTYERAYPRNAQVIAALRSAGVHVTERHVSVWDRREHKWRAGFGTAVRLGVAELRLLRTPFGGFDALVVGYPGHLDLPAARRAAGGAPVVFNPMVSLFDTLVDDRRRFQRRSIPARILAAIDRRAFGSADLVVADTDVQADHFAAVAGIPRERVAACFVGAEDAVFHPVWRPPCEFSVLFVGKLIPLHGVETVLEAARLLPDIRFRVIGSGQLETMLSSAPPNVRREQWLAYPDLPAAYGAAGCALGIFGTSAKAARVIPNKAFQALACGTPLVTSDTPAARELLRDGESALLVAAGDPEALAAAIERLAADTELARRIGAQGRETYETRASEEVLGRRWRELIDGLL
jgi:glycosyltransferase involved in cell wall biosynthesis